MISSASTAFSYQAEVLSDNGWAVQITPQPSHLQRFLRFLCLISAPPEPVVRLGKRKLDVAVQETVCCENLYLAQSLQLDSQSNNQRPYPCLIPTLVGEWQSAADAFERQHLGSDLIAKERKRGLFSKICN